MWRVPVDESSGAVRGALRPVTSGVAHVAEAGLAGDGSRLIVNVAHSTGAILVAAFDPEAERMLGRLSTLLTSASGFSEMDVSADGAWLTYRTWAPREALYVVRTDGTGRRRILDDEHRNRGPRWSPDGRWILFSSNRSGRYESWALRPNGTDLRQLTDTPDGTVGPVWDAGGKRVLLLRVADGTLGALRWAPRESMGSVGA